MEVVLVGKPFDPLKQSSGVPRDSTANFETGLITQICQRLPGNFPGFRRSRLDEPGIRVAPEIVANADVSANWNSGNEIYNLVSIRMASEREKTRSSSARSSLQSTVIGSVPVSRGSRMWRD